jgi:HEAT repeat protein
MGLKEEVKELLRQGREDALAELASTRRGAVRPLLGRLWDPEPVIRQRAASALGLAAAANPDFGVEIVRRLMWALNDESATNGVFGIPALGQIGRRSPQVLSPFLSALASMAWDDGLRLELLLALGAMAETAPELVEPHLVTVAPFVDESRSDEREALRRLTSAVGEGQIHDS